VSAGERAAVAAVSERYRGDNVFRGERATANGSRPIASCGSDNLRNFRQTQGEREMDASGGATRIRSGPIVTVLLAISFSHLLNDTIQAVIPAIYPLLKKSFELTFGQVGLITLTFQLTASVLQPLVGLYADARPAPYSLTIGMGFTLAGITLMSFAGTFPLVLLAAGLVGMGSSIFHPEASRVARLASGGKHGLAQSLFQVGGNAGTSFGPLLAAAIIVPRGQAYALWFTLAALAGIGVLFWVGGWYRQRLTEAGSLTKRTPGAVATTHRARGEVILGLAVLLVLIFSKYFYLASIMSYYTFFLIHKFHASVQVSQVFLFIFLFSVAAGTILGGPIGDRFGRKVVIWISILGAAPFALMLPHASLFWVGVLSVPIGVILASAFSAILVYAQELMPGRVGLVAGLFFGLAFGMAGIGSAVLGELADRSSIEFVFLICSYLPLLGALAFFLPEVERRR
jgi:MFS transporter, FSR family, fosmidomycin resistance protein